MRDVISSVDLYADDTTLYDVQDNRVKLKIIINML